MYDNKLKEVLQHLMDAHGGLSETELARDTGIPQPTLNHILSGNTRKPRKKALLRLAQYFSISVPQLLGHDTISGLPPLIHQINRIPVLEFSEVPMWLGTEEIMLENLSTLSIDCAASPKTFAITLDTSAMSPLFPEDCILIVDPARIPWNRCYVLAQLKKDNGIVFKQYLIDGDHIYLKALHPDFEALGLYRLTPEDKILGVAIQSRMHFME